MSWKAAAALAAEIADRYQRTRLVSRERMDRFKGELAAMDREALIEWLHHRLGEEFRAHRAVCLKHARSEDVTEPGVPSKVRKPH